MYMSLTKARKSYKQALMPDEVHTKFKIMATQVTSKPISLVDLFVLLSNIPTQDLKKYIK